MRVRRWRSGRLRVAIVEVKALRNLRKIDEPLAARPLAELLDETDELPQLKLLYMEVLGRFRGLTSTNAFIRRVMTDPDIEVRERAIDHLKHRGAAEAVTVLINSLKSKKNAVVNRAAWGLGELNDATAIPALIEALNNKAQVSGQPRRWQWKLQRSASVPPVETVLAPAVDRRWSNERLRTKPS